VLSEAPAPESIQANINGKIRMIHRVSKRAIFVEDLIILLHKIPGILELNQVRLVHSSFIPRI
jgi:hypothetical protein